MSKTFFNEQTDQSAVKAAIVSKYFWAWAKVIIPSAKKHSNKLAYIDLFAGPGRYEDGSMSTPLLILKQAIEDPDMREMLLTFFNDVNSDNSYSLKKEIDALPGIKKLKWKPDVENFEVGTEIVKDFESRNLIPTLFFVDPWGYKGLSLKLINSVLKDWGCECIFFFNYNRINVGLPNKMVEQHLNDLFGESRADKLRDDLKGLTPNERELAIVEALAEALKELGGKYVLPFRFLGKKRERTSHHLIFVSKHPLGYKIMKNIMAKESSGEEQGVPTFEYNPAFRKQGLLFELSRPLDDLGEMLLEQYAGTSMTMGEIYDDHNYGHRFIEKNYKAVLNQLESEGRISCDPPAEQRRMRLGERTFADTTTVTFPRKRKQHGTVKH